MGRRSGSLSDLVDISAKLPWWLSLSLAIVSFAILHALATSASTPITRTFASIFQYVLPLAFFLGSLISLYTQTRGRRALTKLQEHGTAALGTVSWQAFEWMVMEWFRSRGYRVLPNGGAQPDGGVDLRAIKNGNVFLVQCKHWRAQRVGVTVVRELYGTVCVERAAGGFIVTSGRFTEEARDFARRSHVELIDGKILEAATARPMPKQEEQQDYLRAAPRCPKCSASMIRRVARRGPNAGNAFWGCSRFPTCRGICE
jgi:restriction system protein